MGVVVRAVLEGDGELEEGEEGDQHGHHALGLAEVGHDEGKCGIGEKTGRV